jgi:hypothetical protein
VGLGSVEVVLQLRLAGHVEPRWTLSNDVVGESLTVPAVFVALGRMAAVRR